MNRLHRAVERRTGFVFGRYRAGVQYAVENRTWLVVSPWHGDHAFCVVLGRRGFYLARAQER